MEPYPSLSQNSFDGDNYMLPESCRMALKPIMRAMRTQLADNKSIPDCVFFFGPDISIPPLVMPLEGIDGIPKVFNVTLAKAVAKKLRPEFVIQTSEKWALLNLKNEDEAKKVLAEYDGKILNCPFREEIIFVTVKTKQGVWVAFSPIKIVDGKQTFDDLKPMLVAKTSKEFISFLPRSDGPTH